MRVAIRADGSQGTGSGHVMRCLTLAGELARRGCEARFVAAVIPPTLAALVREMGHRLVEIESSDIGLERPGWDRSPAPATDQLRDAERMRQALGGWDPDLIILDHYRLAEPWELSAKQQPAKLLVIDDLANRRHACDVLLDQTFGRSPEDYRAIVPPGCRVFAGARYALLRPEFIHERTAALARRRAAGDVERLLITLGATDIGGLSAKVLREALSAQIRCRIDLTIAAAAPSREEVEALAARNENVAIHVDTRDMAALTAKADVAIGAAGTSTWERCCLGVPSVLLVLAYNQRLIARNLQDAGAAVSVNRWEDAVPAVIRLMKERDTRGRMAAAAAAITDGTGAIKIANWLMGHEVAPDVPTIRVRLAEEQDSEALWLWRNDPTMRAMAKCHEPIAWEEHQAWFARCMADEGCLLLIGQVSGEPVGTVRFDRTQNETTLVSINVAPEWRGRGIGTELLRQACHIVDERRGGALEAEIQVGNRASEHIFAKNDFEPTGERSETGYARYLRPPQPKRSGIARR